MNQGPILMIVALLAFIVLAFVVFVKKENKPKTDYKMLANFGIIFTLLGIYSLLRNGSSIFFILGIVSLGVGYSNKDKWKKK